MNYNEVAKMCLNIYSDYKIRGRESLIQDGVILNAVVRIYNVTGINCEDISWLWAAYLETGNLYISEVVEIARARTVNEMESEVMYGMAK